MKVLIVEDDRNSQIMTRMTFEHAGYQAECASDGLEALEKLERFLPDLIVSDVLMPRMDGFALCRHCKTDERYKHIPFIFLTATYLDARDERLAASLGAERYLQKPQTPDALIEIARDVLESRGGRLRVGPGQTRLSDPEFIGLHQEALYRKLMEKIIELEDVNGVLQRDIAARKRMEAALRKSEERFRTLTTFAPVGIYQTDDEGRCVFVNRRWCEITGLSPADAIGYHWVRNVHEEDRGGVSAAWKESSKSGGSWCFEYRYNSPEGKACWVHGTFVALRDEAGGITGYLCADEDITARKEAEETLQFTRVTLENISEGAFWIGRDARFVFVNRAICNYLGYSREELLTMTAIDIDENLSPAKWEDHWRTVKQCGTKTIETRYLPREGPPRPVQVTSFCVKIGERDYHCGFVLDIGDKTKAEERLRESENVLRALVDANPETVLLADAEGRVLTCNDAAARRLGYATSELIGRRVWDFLPPDVAALRKRRYDESFRTGQPVRFEDSREGRIFDNHFYPVFNAGGTVSACAIMAIEITEQKRVERKLLRQAQILDQIQESVITTDLDGSIIGWNKASETMFAYTAEEALGKHVSLIYAEDRQDLPGWALLSSLQATGMHETEARVKRKSGEEFPVFLLFSLLKDEQDVSVGVIVTSVDLSRWKEPDEALRPA